MAPRLGRGRAIGWAGVMDHVVAGPACFRHVVFPEIVGRYGGAVDVAPPDAPALRHAHGAAAGVPPLGPDETAFLSGLFRRVGLHVAGYKPETLARRLPACLRAVRAPSLGHARVLLRHNPRLDGVAMGALLIGVTSFFRDAPVFESLSRGVLPGLVAEASDARRPLRVWSAGCSDGAELYSIAMLLAERGSLSGCDLLGTDCRPAAVAHARAGVYGEADLQSLSPERRHRFLTGTGPQYRVADDLRKACHWRTGDVLSAPEPGPWDLVLCRNLAIYLRGDAAARMWAGIRRVLRPGGVLVLGKAERPVGAHGFKGEPASQCVFRREGTP